MTNVSKSDSFFTKELRAYLKLCEAVDTPRALTCSLLASNGEWEQLLDLQLYHDDQNISTSADNYLVTSVMKKNPRLPLGVDTKQVALDKFLECESLCAETNHKFRTASDSLGDAKGDVRRVLKRARRIISKILGPLSTRDLEMVWDNARFGNGSTSAVSGTDVSSSRKYSALGGTPRLIHMLKTLIPTLWWEGAGTLDQPVVWHSCVSTVPKTAKTDRPICIEPHMNIYVQLGIGDLIRRKLRHNGLDLSHQAEVNSFLASKAQDWLLATIDLESASDTISYALVHSLLPKRWVHLLEMARTDFTKMPDGTIIRLEKWSSMGNGYTFELETLIFWSLALAASDNSELAVSYGDDIIVPQSCSDTLITTLEFCGFRVNRAKTFLGGNFFESCGTDWLSGVDIRPFFMKHEVRDREDQIDAIFKIANQVRLYASRSASTQGYLGCDKRFLRLWLTLHSMLPRHWRQCRVPYGYGDDKGLISNFDEASPSFNRKFGEYRFHTRLRKPGTTGIASWHGYLLSFTRRKQSRRSKFCELGLEDYLEKTPLLSIRLHDGSRKKLKFVYDPLCTDLRGVKKKGQLAVGYVSTWPSLGPWM